MNIVRAAVLACAVIGTSITGTVWANVLEEVIVTAQKREQNLQDVGISVTAFSGQQLEELGLTNTVDIVAQTPGLQLYQFSPSITVFNLRGVSQNNFNDNLEAPVAVYVDDAYVAAMGAINGQLFDVERVEVLRGPQGTLYGRNATGGLVHYVSAKPTENYEGYLKASYSEYDRYSVEGAVGGPLSERARGRLSVRYEKSDGYVESTVPSVGDSLGIDALSVRGQLQFDVSDDVEAYLKVNYAENFEIPDGNFPLETATTDPLTGLGIFTSRADDPFSHTSGSEGHYARDMVTVMGKLTWKLNNGMELVSITNYLTMDKSFADDVDANVIDIFTFSTEQEHEQWSQEVRLSNEGERARWQLGFYYMDFTQDNSTTGTGLISLFPILNAGCDPLAWDPTTNPACGAEPGINISDVDLDVSNWSVFAQGEYDINEEFTFIAGIRFSQDDKEYALNNRLISLVSGQVNQNFVLNGAGIPSAGPPNFYNPSTNPDADIDYGDWAVRLGIDWKPNENSLYFISVNRGIKGGNWTAPTFAHQTVPADLRHDEEILLAYEIGAKLTLWDGRARLNMTGFYYDYSDYQSFDLTNFIQNVENLDADVYGGEIELTLNPAEGWDLLFGLSLLDSEVKGVATVNPAVRRDTELPQAPSYSFNFLGRYEWPAFNGKLAAQFDFVYNDDHFMSVTNGDVDFEDDYFDGNVSLTYTTQDERWSASVWVKNVTDSEYRIWGLDVALGLGNAISTYAPPRWFGGTIQYNWN